MKLNLNGVDPWRAGSAPAPGWHLARIDDAKEATTTSGNPSIKLSWTILNGESQGAEMRDMLVVVESTRGKVVSLLDATGISYGNDEFDLRVGELIGKRAEIYVTMEPGYKDPSKMFPSVSGYRKPTNQTIAAASNGAQNTMDAVPF